MSARAHSHRPLPSIGDRCVRRVLSLDGYSLLEVLVASVLLGIIITGVAPLMLVANSHLKDGQADGRMWGAVHRQMEGIVAQGYDDVSAGSATVDGLAMQWTVQGTNPKRVILEVVDDRVRRTVTDTFVTYIADVDD